ncbi:MAG: regulator [Sulfurovum sp. AS07-7]|nr:MAG: regulator [Sulfurovum sp. AS07-7]
MKILVVDDEILACNRLKRLLENENIGEIKTISNPILALDECQENRYDVVFLDISMPQMSGLELANRILEINPKCYIVFQTAYGEYALEAYQRGGMDYLLKPISSQKLQKALEKISLFVQTTNTQNKKIVAKRGQKLYLLDIEDIYYIEADLDEIIVRFKESDGYVKRKISDIERLLKGRNFFRIHRSCIVNVDKIRSLETIEQSKLKISFQGIDSVVTSSKEGAKAFREYLENQSL